MTLDAARTAFQRELARCYAGAGVLRPEMVIEAARTAGDAHAMLLVGELLEGADREAIMAPDRDRLREWLSAGNLGAGLRPHELLKGPAVEPSPREVRRRSAEVLPPAEQFHADLVEAYGTGGLILLGATEVALAKIAHLPPAERAAALDRALREDNHEAFDPPALELLHAWREGARWTALAVEPLAEGLDAATIRDALAAAHIAIDVRCEGKSLKLKSINPPGRVTDGHLVGDEGAFHVSRGSYKLLCALVRSAVVMLDDGNAKKCGVLNTLTLRVDPTTHDFTAAYAGVILQPERTRAAGIALL